MTYEEIKAAPGGTLLQDGHQKYYVVLEENTFRNINTGTVMELFGGWVHDASWLEPPIKIVSHNEIIW